MQNMRCSSVPAFLRVVFSCLVVSTCSGAAQQNVTGYDAVYNSSGNPAPSPAFTDASISQKANGTNLCDTIYNIFVGNPPNPAYPATGTVVDARGISGATTLTCSSGKTPWSQDGNAHVLNVPSTILLPATTGAAPIGAGPPLRPL